jgi:hypothetical protein
VHEDRGYSAEELELFAKLRGLIQQSEAVFEVVLRRDLKDPDSQKAWDYFIETQMASLLSTKVHQSYTESWPASYLAFFTALGRAGEQLDQDQSRRGLRRFAASVWSDEAVLMWRHVPARPEIITFDVQTSNASPNTSLFMAPLCLISGRAGTQRRRPSSPSFASIRTPQRQPATSDSNRTRPERQ